MVGNAPPLSLFLTPQHPPTHPPNTPILSLTHTKNHSKAETVIRPSALREVSVEVPHVTWDDVGGMDHVKQQLQEVVTWPQQHPDALRRLGVEAPRGMYWAVWVGDSMRGNDNG